MSNKNNDFKGPAVIFHGEPHSQEFARKGTKTGPGTRPNTNDDSHTAAYRAAGTKTGSGLYSDNDGKESRQYRDQSFRGFSHRYDREEHHHGGIGGLLGKVFGGNRYDDYSYGHGFRSQPRFFFHFDYTPQSQASLRPSYAQQQVFQGKVVNQKVPDGYIIAARDDHRPDNDKLRHWESYYKNSRRKGDRDFSLLCSEALQCGDRQQYIEAKNRIIDIEGSRHWYEPIKPELVNGLLSTNLEHMERFDRADETGRLDEFTARNEAETARRLKTNTSENRQAGSEQTSSSRRATPATTSAQSRPVENKRVLTGMDKSISELKDGRSANDVQSMKDIAAYLRKEQAGNDVALKNITKLDVAISKMDAEGFVHDKNAVDMIAKYKALKTAGADEKDKALTDLRDSAYAAANESAKKGDKNIKADAAANKAADDYLNTLGTVAKPNAAAESKQQEVQQALLSQTNWDVPHTSIYPIDPNQPSAKVVAKKVNGDLQLSFGSTANAKLEEGSYVTIKGSQEKINALLQSSFIPAGAKADDKVVADTAYKGFLHTLSELSKDNSITIDSSHADADHKSKMQAEHTRYSDLPSSPITKNSDDKTVARPFDNLQAPLVIDPNLLKALNLAPTV